MPDLIGKIYLAVIISCLALVTVGCGARDTGEDIPPVISVEAQAMTEVTKKPEPTPMAEIVEPISPVSPISPTEKTVMMPPIHKNVEPIKGSEETLTAAIADLVKQTGIPADEITLISMEAVEWSDASLGCPQEGYMYAQVITPGYLIILEAQGQQYEYHTDQTTNVVLCQE
jgi:hypothetical protein